MGRSVAPADAQAGKAMDLREGPGHHHVLGAAGELHAALVVVAPHIFGIGGIDDEEHVGRQGRMQAPHLAEGDVGPGRIVRIGDVDEARPRRDPREDGIDVGRQVLLRRHHRRRAGRLDRDRIDEEAVLGVNRLVTRLEEGIGEQVEDVVRTGAADDPAGIQAEGIADRLAKRRRAAVGIEMELLRGRLVGGDRRGARAERRLVGGELVQLRPAGRLGAARHIRRDVEDAAARGRPRGSGSHLFFPCDAAPS